MLIYNTICSCQPFIEAISKLLVPYMQERLDIFKTSYSDRDAAKILMTKKVCKVPFLFFWLYSKRRADLYRKHGVK